MMTPRKAERETKQELEEEHDGKEQVRTGENQNRQIGS